MADTVQLAHPDPLKKGAIIDKEKYEIVRETIIGIIKDQETISFKDLLVEGENQLVRIHFDGSPSWYCTWVKLDLEAKQIIERIKGSGPQKLRLVSNPKL
jgi:hypothetical protein